MNILILSVGTRNKVVQYFKKEMENIGNVIATDASSYAPALYEADKAYIVPKIDADGYLETIIDICLKENIKGVFSLIDPELVILAKNYRKFLEIGTQPIISSLSTIETSYNKLEFASKLQSKNYKTVPTYGDLESFLAAKDNGEIDFPVFVKPQNGSASININTVNNLEQLNLLFNMHQDLIIQPLMTGMEIGVDAYIDLQTHELVTMFAKEKILMRAGETDKSCSFMDSKLTQLIETFVKDMDYVGVIDIDLFVENNDYIISEVNPRFGGGYPHAYACGVNIPKYIINNLQGMVNSPSINNYEENILMMKYNEVMIRKRNDSGEITM